MYVKRCDLKLPHAQGGFLLVTALGFVILFSVFVFFVSQKLTTVSQTQLLSQLSVQALNAANSGAEASYYQLVHRIEGACQSINRQNIVFDQPGLKQCRLETRCEIRAPSTSSNAGLYLISSRAQCGSKETFAVRSIGLHILAEQDNGLEDYRILYRSLE